MPQDRLFDIWFALRVGIASREFSAVLDSYESTYQLFNADAAELEQLPCGERLRTALGDKSLDEAYRIKSYCEKAGVRLLFWRDAEYPASLRTLLDPPVLLYCLGRLPDFSRCLCISIVGTRTMSEYGKRMAYKIGYELAAAGTVPVSGMALGCDGVATAGALAAGGHPVAVLGSGIDIVYPSGHLTLYRELTAHGTVMTEYPPGTPPEGRNFPVRNRIISGLSQGTVVVEADEHSGALITARTAILQGRDIFAVPGNVGEVNSSGTNALLRDGASMVLSARDILDAYAFLYRDNINWVGLTRAEQRSEPDDDALRRYEIQTRTVSARDPGTRRDGANHPMRRAPAPAPEQTGQHRPRAGTCGTQAGACPGRHTHACDRQRLLRKGAGIAERDTARRVPRHAAGSRRSGGCADAGGLLHGGRPCRHDRAGDPGTHYVPARRAVRAPLSGAEYRPMSGQYASVPPSLRGIAHSIFP